jgi:hypothetical protein
MFAEMITDLLHEIARLAEVLVLGGALFALAWLFWKRRLGTAKINWRNFKIELAGRKLSTDDAAKLARDTIGAPLGISNNASFMDSIKQAVRGLSPVDYCVIDLNPQPGWLTSRLFIFTLLMERMRGLRCLVFVDSTAGSKRPFLGTIGPGRLRWALARLYPWLEESFAHAYAVLGSGGAPPAPAGPGLPAFNPPPAIAPAPYAFQIMSLTGALGPDQAARVIEQYVAYLQDTNPRPPAEEWTLLPSSPVWEHGVWLRAGEGGPETITVDQILGTDFNKWALVEGAKEPEQEVKETLKHPGEHVAVVDANHQFKEVIDRREWVESFAWQLVQEV